MQLQPIVRRLPRTTTAQREEWIKMFRSSGLSRQAFAREHGLKLSSLNRWLAKVNTLPASNSKPLVFTEVNLAGAAPLPAHSWAMEILTPAGLLVRVR